MERVDGLAKAPAGGQDPPVEGEPGRPVSPCSGDGQDGLKPAAEKVNVRKHTPPFIFLLVTLYLSFVFRFFYIKIYLFLSLVLLFLMFYLVFSSVLNH